MKKHILSVAIGGALLSSAIQVNAAGFQLAEYSATGQGRSFAGEAAIADNASAQGRNPALLSYLDGRQFSAGAIYVMPDVDVEGNMTLMQPSMSFDASIYDVADNAVVPNFYYSTRIDEQWAWGLAVNSNYGLKTELPTDHNAAVFGNHTSVTTVELNPNLAYRLSEQVSIGAGLRVVYGEGEISASVPTWMAAAVPVPAGTQLKGLKGDDVALGWQVGSTWQVDENHRFGIAYHSGVKLELAGTASGLQYTGGQPVSIDGYMPLELPAFAEVSSFHQLDNQLAIHTSINWTQWSVFDELRAYFPGDVKPIGNIDSDLVKVENFNDNWRFALGTTYQFNDQWLVRTGIAVDKTAVDDEYRTITIPDSDRIWLSAGIGYQPNKDLAIDVSLTYIDAHGVSKINEFEPSVGATFDGAADGRVWLAGIQMSYKI
ncbi:outer membrane protein transport protein [Shewanella gelidii]|nr:outer membrane protein transport protein [Shewanella gelidii]MCL1098388.1 outer membrane protein transport protein [Shewanella gelidii]